MDERRLIDSLERFTEVLPAALGLFGPEEARWRPAAGGWSVVAIVTHLADEEVEDFRPRLRDTLEDPGRAWSPIDPEGVAERRGYQQADLQESLRRLLEARRESVRWLRGLREPRWDNVYEHPLGPIRAGDLLASWAAHDALHLRQITKRWFQLLQKGAGDFSTAYAGSWTA